MDVTRLARYWGPVALYAGFIFTLSSQSHPDDTLPSFLKELSDKLLHAIEYGILGALCYRGFRWGATESWRRHAVMLAFAAASAYGLTDEIHQWFVPFRESSWQDWVADTIGAAAGALAFHGFAEAWWGARPVFSGGPALPRDDAEEMR